MDFYANLFTKEDGVKPVYSICGFLLPLKKEEYKQSGVHISKEEVQITHFEMGPSKASGKDGYNTFFLKNRWDIVG